MADWRGYFCIENIALTGPQKQTLVDGLRQLGPGTHPQPSHINHWRTRLDNDAAIFEALFNSDHLTIQAFKNRLAAIFSVPAANITHSASTTSYSTGNLSNVVVFSYNSTARLRVILFGTNTGTYDQSHSEVLGYLFVNMGAWEEQGV